MNQDQIDEAINDMMDMIDGHKAAGGNVPRSVSIEFYEGIAESCKERADIIREEDENED